MPTVQVTQLGHVKDLSDAFVKVLDNPKAKNQARAQLAGPRQVPPLLPISYHPAAAVMPPCTKA